MAQLTLSDVVRSLRAELAAAMTEGQGKEVQFQATAVEIELQVGVTDKADGHGGVHIWVLELGGGASHASESIQKIRLSLEPRLSGGGHVTIGDSTDENPLGHTPAQ